MRAILIDWLVQVHMRFKLLQETMFMAVSILDRFLQVSINACFVTTAMEGGGGGYYSTCLHLEREVSNYGPAVKSNMSVGLRFAVPQQLEGCSFMSHMSPPMQLYPLCSGNNGRLMSKQPW